MKSVKRVFLNIWKDVKRYRSGVLALAVYCTVTHIFFHTICPVALVSGFPCPGCGMTRAFSQIITLHFVDAVNMHACIVLWVPLIIWMAVRRWAFEKPGFPVRPLVGVMIITVVYYVWRMVTIYPYRLPMVFREKNLINIVLRAFSGR